MDITGAVAQNIRRIRESKRLTLEAAAAQTGVSRSMLAQIEKGDVNPTISVVWKIANGYKVSFSSLVEPQDEPSATLLRASARAPLCEDDGRYVNHPVFPFEARHGFETYRIAVMPGGRLDAQAHLVGTEEFLTVFSGALTVCAGGERYDLQTGDSLHFKADVPHSYHNPTDAPASVSMVIYYADPSRRSE